MRAATRLTASLMFFVVVGLAAAPEATAVQKPDLIIASAATDLGVVFRNQQQQIGWTIKTKNIGNARAPKSVTGSHPDEPTVFVPALKPGGTDKQKVIFQDSFPAARYPYGVHPVKICADINRKIDEERERNNCFGRRVAYVVIPYFFNGTISGEVPYFGISGVTERWQADVHFTFKEEFIGSGGLTQISYAMNFADITYTVSGTNSAGQAYLGTGSKTIGGNDPECLIVLQAELIDLSNPMFFAGSCVITSLTFPVTITQNGVTIPGGSGPSQPTWLSIQGQLNNGFRTVTGSQTSGATKYDWNLTPSDPA